MDDSDHTLKEKETKGEVGRSACGTMQLRQFYQMFGNDFGAIPWAILCGGSKLLQLSLWLL